MTAKLRKSKTITKFVHLYIQISFSYKTQNGLILSALEEIKINYEVVTLEVKYVGDIYGARSDEMKIKGKCHREVLLSFYVVL